MSNQSRAQHRTRRSASKRNMHPSLLARSDATPALRASFAQKRTKIEIAACIPAARISSEISRLKPSSSPPANLAGWIGVTEWDERWESCYNHAERLNVLSQMDEQLGIQHVDRSEVRGTLEWKLRLAKDPRASAIVGSEAGVSPSRVRQLRMDYVAGKLFEKR